jgi:hypothetical protein
MVSTVKAESEDGQTCRISVESPCEAIQALGEELKEADGYGAAFTNFMENPVYIAAAKHYKHAACPVPSGIVKAIEVACGLALPKDVSFKIEK